MRCVSLHRLSAALTLLLGLLPLASQAETLNCTPITSLPTTISTQGLYCLTGNLATAVGADGYNAITINANNVTLDLNGWKLGGQGAGAATQATGIYSEAANVTIENGIVRGFGWAIWLTGRGAVVQDMLIDQNTLLGIYINGSATVVEHNQVVDTGGSTAFANANAYGIYANCSGVGSLITNNTVSGVTATGTSSEYGISTCGPNSTVRDNVVSDTHIPTGGGTSVGITHYGGSAVNNTVVNFIYGIHFVSGGIFAHNTAVGCTFPYTGGTSGAGNSPIAF
jgi:hypothetical protein